MVRQDNLLEWSERTRRDLPWRHTRDPWKILVSEVMSQQTQVGRVVPKYLAFIEAFPTAAACADATSADIITMWAGLGYNRRALLLHRCAEVLVADHGGALPHRLDALLSLPGIGPYTARAVMAFATEADVGVVDTNAARVLARWHNTTFDACTVQAIADREVPVGQGWAWNQAILDLGATVCTKSTPKCHQCPVRTHCDWRGQGQDPADGTAGSSGRQSRFSGSDRQGRGRLIDALRRDPVGESELASAMGWPDDAPRAARVAATLCDDGMIEHRGAFFQLAGSAGSDANRC